MAKGLEGHYEVAMAGKAIYVRVHGLGSWTNCVCLRAFLDSSLDAGSELVIFDLKDCSGMDSTFMGVMARTAQYESHGRRAGVTVVNGAPELVKLLKELGLSHLILVDPQPREIPDLDFATLAEQASEAAGLRLMRDATRHLIDAAPQNEEAFGGLLEILEMQMREKGLL